MRIFITAIWLAGLLSPPAMADILPKSQTSSSWFVEGKRWTDSRPPVDTPSRARNVILFVGDGMSITTITAARILAGQKAGGSGEEHSLSFERFPHTALVKTYNVDAQVPDSAGTMSAMMTGKKTKIGMFGVGPDALRDACESQASHELPSYLELAEIAGMATGVVSTTSLTHATPAATYSKSINRGWEDDSDLPAAAVDAGCADIAAQFVTFRERVKARHGVSVDGIEVAMGGGRRHFLPADPEFNSADAQSDVEGDRRDGRHLIDEWRQRNPGGRYIMDLKGFESLDTKSAEPVLALFNESHMRYDQDRQNDVAGEPALADMTRAAIEILQQDPDGFFLMVEGGRIDHAHHAGNAYHALHDTLALAQAVAVADELTSADDTLIVVTADHGHVLTLSGYAPRGNPILGLSVSPDGSTPVLAADGRPYTTLNYANGAGMRFFEGLVSPDDAPRQLGKPRAQGIDLREVDTEAPWFFQESLVPLPSETHSGDDVALFARGPGASAFTGVIEQSAVFEVLNAGRELRSELSQ